jgi:hypothetical protein
MPTQKSNIQVYLSDEQLEAAKELMRLSNEKSASEMIRKLIADACQKHNIKWSEDNSRWGGKRIRPKRTSAQ